MRGTIPGSAALAAIAGASLLGLSPIGVRLSELGPQATNLWRFLFALPLLAIWAWSGGRTPSGPQAGWLVIAGLLFGLELSLWAQALSHTTVANATLFSNMTPIFAAAFAWFVFKERARAGVYWGGALALMGAAILAVARACAGAGPAETAEEGWFGDALGFSSALGYAGYLLIVRYLGGQVSTGTVMLIATSAAAAYALALCVALGEPLLPQTPSGWLILIGMGVVVQVGAQGLIAYGVARLPIAASTIMLWMQPVTAAIWSWLLFGESLGPMALGGAALILAGIFLVQRARA
jgi:drug/metabolite transporter (DMT)-like permease